MSPKNFVLIAMAASLVLGGFATQAQDAGALLDLFVKKKIITHPYLPAIPHSLPNPSFSLPSTCRPCCT